MVCSAFHSIKAVALEPVCYPGTLQPLAQLLTKGSWYRHLAEPTSKPVHRAPTRLTTALMEWNVLTLGMWQALCLSQCFC